MLYFLRLQSAFGEIKNIFAVYIIAVISYLLGERA